MEKYLAKQRVTWICAMDFTLMPQAVWQCGSGNIRRQQKVSPSQPNKPNPIRLE